ncbi:MAG TPA: dihydrodipicolinate synthase family protein [Gemmataceae bacterium]|nr:dihydrodipicolinate synthase family protein [Gemmataceae bacterium]
MKRYPACILATCCIPWDGQGRFAEPIFRRGVRSMLSAGTKHLYVFGTAGEGYAVTEQQFDRIVTVFAEEMRRGDAEPMVGLISPSLGTIRERIERCRDRGVRLFQIALPCWGALSDAELSDFFRQVCGRFRDCRFVHYNLPRAQRLVTGKEYGQLAEEHPNLVGTKNCGDSMAHIQSLLEDAPPLQHFLSETGYVYGSLFGECGLLASFITSWPKMRALLDAGKRRDLAALAVLQREINVVTNTLVETLPDKRIDGAYDKLFEKMHDPEFPLRLLPPYVGMSDEQYRAFVELLRQRLPDWVPRPSS